MIVLDIISELFFFYDDDDDDDDDDAHDCYLRFP